MIFFISFMGAFFWFCFVLLLLYIYQRPEAQVRRRVNLLVKNAEEERAKKISQEKKFSELQQLEEMQQKQQGKFYSRFVSPIFDKLDEKFQKFAPAQIKYMLEEKIFQAGMTGVWNLQRIISFWVFMVLLGTGMGIFITYKVHFHFLQEAMIIFLGFIWGAALPLVRLNTKIINRKKIMRRTLPEFLDLLCVSVQAGLSFDGAISKITARMKGPLSDEFKRMQSDMSLGMTQEYALNQLARRCNLEEIYLFTTSVIQAAKLGTSMSRTLKIQADNMRERHRQFIKAEALKAPIKIIFPMVIFIFPSIFVVLLFPAVLMFVKSMSG